MDYETPQFFRVMQYADAASGDVIDMVSGNPDWDPPEALRDGLREYADAEPAEFQYPASEGWQPLREEIATRRGVDVERVLVTSGAGEANHLAMTEGLTRHDGSEVILADPVYPYYAGRTNLLGGRARYVPVDEAGRLDPDAVREVASDDTALIVINSPNNPTGAVYPGDTVRELVGIAEDNDALLLSDEVYDHFDYTGEFESALSVDSPNRVVTNSFSKSMAITGFRVGYGIYPERLIERIKTRHMLTNLTVSRPAQVAVYRALGETPPDYYAENRRRMESRIEAFTDALDAAGAEYTTPDGGFYVMARFDGFPGTMDNVERLIDEAGVAGMPGEAFGERRSAWFRFALVTPRVEEAAQRLADYFD
ncbi:pyridoxal phosphate-dependent aminotransferase [Halorientalis salina]|uniref:pyridoxal phosphate-dependent aminotransferase n=1 Tax=Halorientalis salina TaxID=2932266 RepID=UPI0010AC01F0|nr:pyridoxal phosphate-dependent aminotransferase [Halorientalis salina]